MLPACYPREHQTMPAIKLTDATVKALKAPKGARLDFFDATLPGFAVRVSGPTPTTPEGRRTWALFYRHGGKQRRLSFAPPYPALGLADARRQAGDALARLAEGKDPAADRAATKAEAARAPDTVAGVVDLFIRRGLEAKKRAPRYVTETRRNFDLHVLPRWGERDIKTITRREVIDLLDAIADGGAKVKGKDGKRRTLKGGPIAANRTLAAIKACFNFAVRRGIIEASPVALVERPGAETKRERALTDDEIRALWPHMGALGYPFGPFLRVLLLTGQRRGEVAGMRWQDMDLTAATWTLAAEATKAGRAHIVPLPAPVVAILAGLPRLGAYVFAGTGRRSAKRDGAANAGAGAACPISGFAKCKARIDRLAGGDAIEPWTLHDLRRTCATGLARLGIDRLLISKLLNHADRSVTAIYDRHAYLAEKRAALAAWGEHVAGLTEPPAGNVVPLRAVAHG